MASPARAYWKGYLKLSLVTCPIALYPASSLKEKVHFHQINNRTGHRLRQQMVDEATGEAVSKDEKSRGYEVAKGRYVEIGPEELKAIQMESTHTLDIERFVPVDEIDRRYFERAYYLVPDGRAGEEAFAVIRDAMKNKKRVALARIVLTNREHVMAIEPFGKGMLGTVLRYDYEVRDEKEIFRTIPNPKISKEMIDLAAHILDSKAGHFEPSQFKDEFELELRKLVKRKAAGKTIDAPEKIARPANVVDLMQALRQSVQGRDARGRHHVKPSAAHKTPGTAGRSVKKKRSRRAA